MKLQGREGMAERALSAESGEGSENEIGPLDDEQMGGDISSFATRGREGEKTCRRGFAVKP